MLCLNLGYFGLADHPKGHNVPKFRRVVYCDLKQKPTLCLEEKWVKPGILRV